MERYVTNCLLEMYSGFDRGREHLTDDQIVDVRYEDLARAPLETLEELYHRLNLGSFEAAKPALQKRLASHADYRPNRHSIDEDLRRRVLALWPDYAHRYGYAE